MILARFVQFNFVKNVKEIFKFVKLAMKGMVLNFRVIHAQTIFAFHVKYKTAICAIQILQVAKNAIRGLVSKGVALILVKNAKFMDAANATMIIWYVILVKMDLHLGILVQKMNVGDVI